MAKVYHRLISEAQKPASASMWIKVLIRNDQSNVFAYSHVKAIRICRIDGWNTSIYYSFSSFCRSFHEVTVNLIKCSISHDSAKTGATTSRMSKNDMCSLRLPP